MKEGIPTPLESVPVYICQVSMEGVLTPYALPYEDASA